MKKDYNFVEKFNLEELEGFEINFTDNKTNDDYIKVVTPIDRTFLASVKKSDRNEYEKKITVLKEAENEWKKVPAPQRGELIRIFGGELRKSKQDLGKLVTIETGKILQEGLGEIQEMIDICDFAVGLSRQLYGLTMPSERPGHRIQEIWHSLGTIGIITSFNFPSTLCFSTLHVLWETSYKVSTSSSFISQTDANACLAKCASICLLANAQLIPAFIAP